MASEQQRWLEEERGAWEERREELLLAAHRQWSLAQEPVHREEVERAWQEGAELATREHKVCTLPPLC